MFERNKTLLVVLGLATLIAASPAASESSWTQWGGPARNFQIDGEGLASSWPEGGPKLLWERPLGEGFSSILADGGRLYTQCNDGGDEVVIAVDPADGKTIWEQRYSISIPEEMLVDFGPGPYSTPALAGGKLFTIGITLRIHALDAASGEVLWSHNLREEMEAPVPGRGFGSSPLVVGDLVVFASGAARDKDGGVVAFRASDGEEAWRSEGFRSSYSSPILARVAGEDQILIAQGPVRAGLDPRTGEVRWKLELARETSTIMSTQIWNEEEEILFGSSAYADGSRAIRVTKKDGEYAAEELWYTRKMRVQHGTAVRVGDLIYGSSGDFGPAFLTAVDVKTGELAFRQRGFSKANFVHAGGKLLLLDEDGNLALGTPGPDGIEIHAQAKILDRLAWTVPTLVGTRIYVRDRKNMKAFDLGS